MDSLSGLSMTFVHRNVGGIVRTRDGRQGKGEGRRRGTFDGLFVARILMGSSLVMNVVTFAMRMRLDGTTAVEEDNK